MREFFRGWRRKVGCVLLVMAVLVAGVWIRSQNTVDMMEMQSPAWGFVAVSGEGRLLLLIGDKERGEAHFQKTGVQIKIGKRNPMRMRHHVNCEWYWAESPNVDIEMSPQDGADNRIPYWFITIVPALLSAYLLLWKPRTKPKNAVDQFPKVGA